MSKFRLNRGLEAYVKSILKVGSSEESPMIMKWTLTDPGDLTVKLWGQIGVGAFYNYDVDWGDAAIDIGVTTNDFTHTYSGTGTYIVTISKQFAGLRMGRALTPDRLKLITFSSWGTTEINGLFEMFYDCTNLIYTATDAPDITSLTADQGGSMNHMFFTTGVTDLNLSNWTDTTSINSMRSSFSNASNLLTINLTGWDVSNVTTIQDIFNSTGDSVSGCIFTLPNLNLSSCTSIIKSFFAAQINTIDLSNWNLNSSGVSMSSTFMESTTISPNTYSLDLSTWTNTVGITTLSNCWRGPTGFSGLDTINLTGWDTSNVTSFTSSFLFCQNLKHVSGLNGLDATSVLTCINTFTHCMKLDFETQPDANFGVNWGPNLGNCISFGGMFYNVGSIAAGSGPPDVSNWDMSAATTIGSMFKNCKHSSGSLDISSWDVTSLTGTALNETFSNTSSTVLDVSGWELSGGVTSLSDTFSNTVVSVINFNNTNSDFSSVGIWYNFGLNSMITSLRFPTNANFGGTSNMVSFLFGTSIPANQYDDLLVRLSITNGNAVILHAGNSNYTAVIGGPARAILTGFYGWTITDGGAI